MRIAMSVCVYYSLNHLFSQHGWVAHINENCNVCMCVLIPWSPIFPAWRGLLRELRIAMSVCVYYSLDHLFSRQGWGCSQNLELQCLYVYIIPLVFPQAWRGIFREMRIALSVRVYYSLDHVFHQTWRGLLTEMRIAMSVRVYYSLDHLFP